MERTKLSNDSHLWNSHFSTLAPETFSGKSESVDNFFISSFSWKHTEKGLFCIHLYEWNSTSESLLSDQSLDIKKNPNITEFASSYKKTKPCPKETNRTFAIYFKVTGMLNSVFQHPLYVKNKKQNGPLKASDKSISDKTISA